MAVDRAQALLMILAHVAADGIDTEVPSMACASNFLCRWGRAARCSVAHCRHLAKLKTRAEHLQNAIAHVPRVAGEPPSSPTSLDDAAYAAWYRQCAASWRPAGLAECGHERRRSQDRQLQLIDRPGRTSSGEGSGRTEGGKKERERE